MGVGLAAVRRRVLPVAPGSAVRQRAEQYVLDDHLSLLRQRGCAMTSVVASLFHLYVEGDTRDDAYEAAQFTLGQFPPMVQSTIREPQRVSDTAWVVQCECWWTPPPARQVPA